MLEGVEEGYDGWEIVGFEVEVEGEVDQTTGEGGGREESEFGLGDAEQSWCQRRVVSNERAVEGAIRM